MKKQLALLAIVALATVSCQSNYPDFPDSKSYSSGNGSTTAKITKVEIDWLDGDVCLGHSKQKNISWKESYQKGAEDVHSQLRYYIEGSTLHIRFCEPGQWKSTKNLKKNLDIEFPYDMVVPEIDIEQFSGATRANLQVTDLNVENEKGDMYITCLPPCRSIDLETVSGHIELSLSKYVPFVAVFNTVSGKFYTDFEGEYSKDGKVFIFGTNPETHIELSTFSGNASVAKLLYE